MHLNKVLGLLWTRTDSPFSGFLVGGRRGPQSQ